MLVLCASAVRASRQAERHAALKRRFDAECGVLERLRADVRRMERDAAALVSAAEEFPTVQYTRIFLRISSADFLNSVSSTVLLDIMYCTYAVQYLH